MRLREDQIARPVISTAVLKPECADDDRFTRPAPEPGARGRRGDVPGCRRDSEPLPQPLPALALLTISLFCELLESEPNLFDFGGDNGCDLGRPHDTAPEISIRRLGRSPYCLITTARVICLSSIHVTPLSASTHFSKLSQSGALTCGSVPESASARLRFDQDTGTANVATTVMTSAVSNGGRPFISCWAAYRSAASCFRVALGVKATPVPRTKRGRPFPRGSPASSMTTMGVTSVPPLQNRTRPNPSRTCRRARLRYCRRSRAARRA